MLSQVLPFDLDPGGSRSQTSAAYAQLRADIVAGRLEPGERLKIKDLASALSVSPGAIREALSRLVPEQLVVSRDQKGFVVAPVSIEDLDDLTDLRCDVEAIALRRSVLQGSDTWEGSVLSAAHMLRKTKIISPTERSSNADWVERHRAFHAALVSACGSPRLLDLHGQLYQQSERYRSLSFPTDGERDRQGEHQAIADAALDRDADLLVDLMFRHYHDTTSRIVTAARREVAGKTITSENAESHPRLSSAPPEPSNRRAARKAR
jgi:GntR family carbon starvation induced transcriptional regulator